MPPIALLSVSNKEGIIPFAQELTSKYGFKIISSGGTAKTLESASIPVKKVSEYTNSPEILGGRVKTLHPKVHGGILAKRKDSSHQIDIKEENINLIDLVVVNLYPFEKTVSDPDVQWEKAIENIDIGGPAMIRAAAKNHDYVSILTRPSQYKSFLDALKDGAITNKMRRELALEAFEHTASYDAAISKWMQNQINDKPSSWIEALPIKQNLRYGENPHQKATWYSSDEKGWGGAKQLQGKEISTNNLLDLEAALSTVREFGYGVNLESKTHEKAAVVIKHSNPCGVAIGESISSALEKALDADRTSAFGGIVAMNSSVNKSAANQLKGLFLECIVAPHFEEDAKKILSDKKNLRLIELNELFIKKSDRNNIRSILGGLVIQESDDNLIDKSKWKIVTKKQPSSIQEKDLSFAWKVVRHVRSNAITIAYSGQTIGIGAGQMNRVGAAKIALEQAGEKANKAVLASDGFLPFDDTVRMAAKYGIKAIIQPGGSIKDELSITACDELNIAMIFTGKRHFLH